jgi:hypothetical protein
MYVTLRTVWIAVRWTGGKIEIVFDGHSLKVTGAVSNSTANEVR